MTEDQQLKLQAFLDGELPEGETRQMAALVARDAEAANLVAELRNTRRALAGFEPARKVPETREFYWSKISRRIERQEQAPVPPRAGAFFVRLRKLLMPAAAFAALAIVAAVAVLEYNRSDALARSESEMTSADSGAFTYQDEADGTTLVWLSYPAEGKSAAKSVQ